MKKETDLYVRPSLLDDFIGQKEIVDNLRIYIQASKQRNEILDHCLFYGPPGLGKTSLAYIIANETNGNIKEISGPSIERVGDLAAILSSLAPGDVLFIDEIHRIDKKAEELLYSAMENYKISILYGHEEMAKQMDIALSPFVLVGATTKLGLISKPLRDRFGIIMKLDYYKNDELTQIILRLGKVFDIKIDENAASEIAKRSKNTPRIAINIFKRIRDYLTIENIKFLNQKMCLNFLEKMNLDEIGLNVLEKRYLILLNTKYNGGPVGIDLISLSLGEERNTIEDAIEPGLIRMGFIDRTLKGRILTKYAKNYLKLFIK